LGNVLVRLGRNRAAAATFRSAWRYSETREEAAGAALLEGAAHLSVGDSDAARKTLAFATEHMPECAELWLLAAQAGQPGALVVALNRAPELVLDLKASGTEGLSAACRQLLNSGYESRAEEALRRIETGSGLVRSVGVKSAVSLPPKPMSEEPIHLF